MALGGSAAFEKLHTRLSQGKLEIAGEPETRPITIYEAEPDKFYSITQMPGVTSLGQIEEGTDGTVFWRMTALGAKVLEGRERAMRLREATFNSLLHLRRLFQKIECVGHEKVDERDCYKLVLTPPEGGGPPEYAYFDCESHLPVRNVRSIQAWGSEVTTEVFFSDYRRVDGVLIPHKLLRRNSAIHQDVLVTFDSIQNNVAIPPDRFEPPDAVKQLLTGKTASQPGSRPSGGPRPPIASRPTPPSSQP